MLSCIGSRSWPCPCSSFDPSLVGSRDSVLVSELTPISARSMDRITSSQTPMSMVSTVSSGHSTLHYYRKVAKPLLSVKPASKSTWLDKLKADHDVVKKHQDTCIQQRKTYILKTAESSARIAQSDAVARAETAQHDHLMNLKYKTFPMFGEGV